MVIDTNVTTIIGRLTKDAELKQEPLQIGFFTIATNQKKKNSDGSQEPEASFFDVNVFGNYAEVIIPQLKKGQQVSIIAELKQERWTDKEGNKKTRILLVAKSIQIIGGKNAQ